MRITLGNYKEKWQQLLQKKSIILEKKEADINWSKEAEQSVLGEIAVLSFVGGPGTGKSTRAQTLCHKFNIAYFIDDGLLISGTNIIAGSSAKRAKTRFDSIRQAIFAEDVKAEHMRRTLWQYRPATLMILGTSEGMIHKICDRLYLNKPSMVIYIEDVASEEERSMARHIREISGQHIIPVPSMEVKHEFNGYFFDALDVLQKRFEISEGFVPPPAGLQGDKTVVRPTFSSLGKYSISDDALQNMCKFIVNDIAGLCELRHFSLSKNLVGISLNLEVSIYYGYKAQDVLSTLQKKIATDIERYTSINVLSVNTKAVRLVLKNKNVEAEAMTSKELEQKNEDN